MIIWLYDIICTIFTSLSLSRVLHRLFSTPNKVGWHAGRTSNSGGPPAEQWRMQCVPLTCGACLERQGCDKLRFGHWVGLRVNLQETMVLAHPILGFEDVTYFQSSHEFALQQSNMECWEIPPFSLMMFPARSLSLVRGVRSSPCLSTPKNSQSQSHVYGGFLKKWDPQNHGFQN